MLLIPSYLDIQLAVGEGFKNGTAAEWQELKDMYRRAVDIQELKKYNGSQSKQQTWENLKIKTCMEKDNGDHSDRHYRAQTLSKFMKQLLLRRSRSPKLTWIKLLYPSAESNLRVFLVRQNLLLLDHNRKACYISMVSVMELVRK